MGRVYHRRGRLASPASAQQAPTGAVHGTVVDSASGAPLVGALVTLDAGRRAEFTHGDGTFNFPRLEPGTHDLAVERLGYARFQRAV